MTRAALLGCACAAIGVALYCVPAVPAALMDVYSPRTRPFEAADLPQARAVVLLGPGTERVFEAARVYRLLDRPWIISSGGPPGRRWPTAIVMRDALVRLEVPRERILLEVESATTRDEATFVAPMLRRLECRAFVLVTSRAHMPRALAAFRGQGLEPVPAVAPDVPEPRPVRPWLPDPSGLRLSRTLTHEVLGLAYYWIRGWTD